MLAAALWVFTTLGAGSPLWDDRRVARGAGDRDLADVHPADDRRPGQLPGELDSHGSAIMATLQQVAGAAGTALFITVMTVAFASATAAPTSRARGPRSWCAAIIATIALPLTFLVGAGKEKAETAALEGPEQLRP